MSISRGVATIVAICQSMQQAITRKKFHTPHHIFRRPIPPILCGIALAAYASATLAIADQSTHAIADQSTHAIAEQPHPRPGTTSVNRNIEDTNPHASPQAISLASGWIAADTHLIMVPNMTAEAFGMSINDCDDRACTLLDNSGKGDAGTSNHAGTSNETGRSNARTIQSLMNPASVAVIGASRRNGSVGAAIVANLKRDGFNGPIYPVNPNADRVQGLRAYPSVVAIAAPVDLAVLVVPAKYAEQAVDDCIEAGVSSLLVITAGFAEVGEEGRAVEQRILQKVRSAGIRMVGPNCMGMINTDPAVRLNVTFTPIWPPEGNIGIASQSGALGLTILDHMKQLNLGISTFVSVGNKADVSSNDLLEYWADDPNTDVVLLYLESFGNPRKFARIAPEVVRKKPVIAVKAGRSAAGSRAASSHSAALANLDVAVDALFEQAGVIRTNTLEEMFDVAALLSTQPIPPGRRVGVVTNAGGPGILLADVCEARGLTLPELSDATIAGLKEFLPPHAGMANPIDLVGSDSPEWYERSIELVGQDPNIDSLVVIFIPPLVTTRPEEVAAGMARGAERIPSDKPVLCTFLGSRGTPDMLGSGSRGRIPAFAYPENAAMALAAAHGYGLWRDRDCGRVLTLPDSGVARIRSVVDRAMAASPSGAWLSPADLSEVIEAAEISYARPLEASGDEAVSVARQIGYPVVAKAVAKGLVHRSDVGGVILGLQNADDVEDAVRTLRVRMQDAGLELDGVLIQKQVEGGIEALVGMTSDPVFGPLVVCGLGGVHVELLNDVSFRLTPVSDLDAEAMVGGLRSAKLLDGYRGGVEGDRAALTKLIQQVSALVTVAPEIMELDLNPVKVMAPGMGVITVDARVRLEPPPAGTGRRRRDKATASS